MNLNARIKRRGQSTCLQLGAWLLVPLPPYVSSTTPRVPPLPSCNHLPVSHSPGSRPRNPYRPRDYFKAHTDFRILLGSVRSSELPCLGHECAPRCSSAAQELGRAAILLPIFLSQPWLHIKHNNVSSHSHLWCVHCYEPGFVPIVILRDRRPCLVEH